METTAVNVAPAAEKIGGVPTICLLGKGGAGKTRLASLYPDAYCLDIEGGAGSAFRSTHRQLINLDLGFRCVGQIKSILQDLNALAYHDKRLWKGDMPIGAVVLDSWDSLQQVVKYAYLERKVLPAWQERQGLITAKMEQTDWGQLLDIMMPLLIMLPKMKVPVILINHVDETSAHQDNKGNLIYGHAGLSIQGALRTQMDNWMHYILHLVAEQDPNDITRVRRMCYTDRVMRNEIELEAKDRHHIFYKLGKTEFEIAEDPARPGFPKTRAMQLIYDSHEY